MPIIGLTDDITPRLPSLGKLRKGGEKTAKGFGPDLDHFRFTSDRPEIVKAFVAEFGTQPRSLLVYTIGETPQDVFPNWAEIWDASGLVHRCDGKTMSIWRKGDKYETGALPCAGGHAKDDYKNDVVGRLEVIIPALLDAGFVGTVTMETHSINDVLAISRSLAFVYNQRGNLSGAAFNLRRVKENISVPGFGERKGQRSRVDKWLVKLEPVAEWARAQIAKVSEFALLEGPTVDAETGEIDPEPTPEPPTGPMTVEQARAVTTDKGNPLGTLTHEQLSILAAQSKDPERVAAATLLLNYTEG